jgi:SAM-dependent methyltransferase
VLDLGCGDNSPIQYCLDKTSVGVEYFMPYLLESKRKNIHRYYVRGDIENIEFKPLSFDAVLLLSTIEHIDKDSALRLLDKVTRFARKKIIITTPNGYIPQGIADENPLQMHKSGWTVDEFLKLGFKAYGISGFKIFKTNNSCEDRKNYRKALVATIKFKPRLLWLAISELSQIIAYYFPRLAFEVFYVKDNTVYG